MEYLDSVSLRWHWEYAFFTSFPPPCPLTPEKWRKSSFFFFFGIFVYSNVVDLQHCVHFCCTAKWFCYPYIYSFPILSIIVYHKILDMVPCAIGQDMLFIHSRHNSLHLLIPNSQPNLPFCWQWLSLFSMFVSLFLFCRQVHLSLILDPTCKWHHMASVFFFLTYFT